LPWLHAFVSDLQKKAFLVAFIAGWHTPTANNKTAAFAGRCFVWAYRRGRRPRQAAGSRVFSKKVFKNSILDLWYYFTAFRQAE
jgi:hypothetical protein